MEKYSMPFSDERKLLSMSSRTISATSEGVTFSADVMYPFVSNICAKSASIHPSSDGWDGFCGSSLAEHDEKVAPEIHKSADSKKW
ncbi:MAG: hypothetical protein J6C77_00450, partial [Muribaculaceae bacterium]|nr:hypothetical protein [Muribaculaceae bacterium]